MTGAGVPGRGRRRGPPRGRALKGLGLGLAMWAGGACWPGMGAAQVSLTGTSGYWNTPSAQVLEDSRLEFGYNTVSKRWAYDHRGAYRNDIYFATLGFLSRVEISLRVTAIPGLVAFSQQDSTSRLTDSDRMVSARVELLRASGPVPDVAVGIEDLEGTRRFHTGYVVVGRAVQCGWLRLRADAGYAGGVLRPRARVTLDGLFAGAELRAYGRVALVAEYDTEKWNLGLKARGPLGLTGRLAWLNSSILAGGLGVSLNL